MNQINTDRAENKAATTPLEIQDTNKTNTIKQNTANLPPSILPLKRFIPVDKNKRGFTGWGDAANWKTLKEVLELISHHVIMGGRAVAGFGLVITGTDFLVIDGDHVLNDKGQFINERVRAFFDALKKLPATFAERSQSGNGLHFIYEVPSGLLSVSTLNNGNCTLYLEEDHGKNSAKVELYYHTGRQFVLTGDLLPNVPKEISKANKDVIAFIEDVLKRAIADKEKRAAVSGKQQSTKADADNNSDSKGILALDLLQFIPPDCTYDEWRAVGMALQYEGCSLEDFVSWSETGAKFKGFSDCQKHWKTFKKKDKVVTGRTISYIAKDYRGEKTIKDFISNWYAEHNISSPDDDFTEIAETPITGDFIPVPQWPFVDVTKKSRPPIKQRWENTAYMLKRLNIICRYNSASKNIEFDGHNIDKRLDPAITDIRGLAYTNGLKLSKQDTVDHVIRIAYYNEYSPVQDYLNACYSLYSAGGANPVHTLFSTLSLDKTKGQNSAFCLFLLQKWLISCARIAFNQGKESTDGILILQGPQGIGKTTFLRSLSPCPEWVAEGLTLDPDQKDDLLKVMSHWLVELGEFGGTLNRTDRNVLKNYITAHFDQLRKPYGRANESTPRQTAFYGSINDTEFLKDPTGSRRFWVISVRDINLSALSDFKEKHLVDLWGYIMHLVRDKGLDNHLSKEEQRTLEQHNTSFKKVTEEELALLDAFAWNTDTTKWKKWCIRDISDNCGFRGGRLVILGRVLSDLSKRDERIKITGDSHHGRKYLLPPSRFESDSMFPS